MKTLYITQSFFGTIPERGMNHEANWAGIPCDLYFRYALVSRGYPHFPVATLECIENQTISLNEKIRNKLFKLFETRSTLIFCVPALFEESMEFIECLTDETGWEVVTLELPESRTVHDFYFFGYTVEQEEDMNLNQEGFHVFKEKREELVGFSYKNN